jgi:hypothetical protein
LPGRFAQPGQDCRHLQEFFAAIKDFFTAIEESLEKIARGCHFLIFSSCEKNMGGIPGVGAFPEKNMGGTGEAFPHYAEKTDSVCGRFSKAQALEVNHT